MPYSLASAPSECLIKVQLTLLVQGLGAILLPICSAKALPDMFLCFHSNACHPGSHQCTDPNIPAFRELHCLILGQTRPQHNKAVCWQTWHGFFVQDSNTIFSLPFFVLSKLKLFYQPTPEVFHCSCLWPILSLIKPYSHHIQQINNIFVSYL